MGSVNINMLRKLIDYQPHIAVVFDAPGGTFRNQIPRPVQSQPPRCRMICAGRSSRCAESSGRWGRC